VRKTHCGSNHRDNGRLLCVLNWLNNKKTMLEDVKNAETIEMLVLEDAEEDASNKP
jgi:hypothetical protein